MGLSSRELLLILRLQDQASGALRSVATNLGVLGQAGSPTAAKMMAVGSAVSQIGQTMTLVGGIGSNFFNGAIDGAMEYDHQASLAATQSKNVGVSFEQLKDIGMRVGKDIPVAWDKVQPTLYDIFSTINTDGAGAEQALKAFSTAAVAGGADVQDVARLSMAEMNVFGLGVKDLGHLLDTQFRLVQLGRGTYQEFSSAMGKSIPTAKAAGQSLDTLSGMMAFLTRNGLSVAEATSSAGRAMEMLIGKKGQDGLKKLGIGIYDSNGKVKQMNQLMTELGRNKGWAQMDEAARKRWFETIFGKGTIQARRFFDAAIPNYEQLNDLTNQMTDSSGALADAFAEVQKNDPTYKAKLLENQYKALKQQIGDQLIPAKLKLMEILSKIMGWFTRLSPTIQKVVVAVLAGASAFFLVVGPILMVVGSVIMMIGTLSALGVTIGGAAIAIGGFLVVVALLAAAGYLIYKNWDKVKPVLEAIWNSLKLAWQAFIDGFNGKQNADGIVGFIQDLGNKVKTVWTFLKSVFDEVVGGVRAFWQVFTNPEDGTTSAGFAGALEDFALFLRNDFFPAMQDVWNWLQNTAWPVAKEVFSGIADAAQVFWDKAVEVVGWFEETFGPGLERIWNSLKENIPPVISEIIQTVQSMIDKFSEAWPAIQKIGEVIESVFNFLKPYIATTMAFLVEVIIAGWNFVKNEIKDIWDFISRIISDAIAIISNTIQLWLNIFQGDWGEAWNNLLNILRSVWDALGAVVRFGWETIKNLFWLAWNYIFALMRAAITDAIRYGTEVMHGLWSGLVNGAQLVWNFANSIQSTIRGIFSGAGSWLWDAGSRIIGGLIDGISSKVQALKNKLQQITSWIPSWKGPSETDKRLLVNNGQMIMQGLVTGLDDGMGEVKSYLQSQTLASNFTPNFAPGGGNNGGGVNTALTAKIDELIDAIKNQKAGMTVENLTLGSASDIPELDWWSRIRFAGN